MASAAPTALATAPATTKEMTVKDLGRGAPVAIHNVKDKKLRGNLKKLEKRYKDAAKSIADSSMLLQESAGFLQAEGMEKTWKFQQKDIVKEVDVSTAAKSFSLKLDTFGPYYHSYTRNGRHLLLAGAKGHLAAFDWREGTLHFEIHLRETIRDCTFLHNEQYNAVAQKKYAYIYDFQGTELHKLPAHIEVTHMEFLPYHFLLVTVGNAGYLKYQDTSTGQLVTEIRTGMGAPTAMAQNPRNAIILLGHTNGTVTMWSPNLHEPHVKVLCHHGPVRCIAVNRLGTYMVTGGADSKVHVWDLRHYRQVHTYYTPTPPTSLSISDTGLLCIADGPRVNIFRNGLSKKQDRPYLSHMIPGVQITQTSFVPFEDILGISHSKGFDSIIVPGAGEANFDAMEANPFETSKQRREMEVRSLLDKIAPEMIAMDPDMIGKVDRSAVALAKQEAQDERAGRKKEETEEQKRKRMRGKNSAMKRYVRKKNANNVIDAKTLRYEELKKQREARKLGLQSEAEKLGPALERFARPTRHKFGGDKDE
ncbi:BING4CT-domain-containing protein [Ascobolus immersus RN42]|uniref:U three protein 7 n=1 Tax=Ascobolus immersus RN42 TaxID=1160509 RepID=A0A3N4IA46_ASCIM|nr:BING4CT-domain-containing protein [Ascobolus immersus RN42]